MKVINIDDLINTDRAVNFHGGVSLRPILESENMGYSLHKTLIRKGGPYHWHYINHLESCYCVSGRGLLVNLETHDIHIITPGMVYLLNQHDDHTFEAIDDTILISIFTPALTGTETHDKNGVYERKTINSIP